MTDAEVKTQEPHLEDEDLFEEFALDGELQGLQTSPDLTLQSK